MKTKKLTYLLAACTAAGAMCANGDTYTLINTSGTASVPAEFSDLNNWTVGGVTATVLPGAGDTITWEGGDWIYPYIALDNDYSVGSLTKSFRRPHWVKSANAAQDVVTLTFVTQLGGSAYQNYFVHQGVKMVVAASATLKGATGDATSSEATVQDGGEIDVLGAVDSRHIKWSVKSGGKLYFAPTSYSQRNETASINDMLTISDAASTIEFPNGLVVTGGSSSYANQFNHNDGTVTFGGPFTSSTSWTYTWAGGTINVTGDCMFGGNVALTVPASASVVLDVAAGKTFSAPGLAADASATITKTGAGTFAFAPTSASIVLEEGSLGLASAATYDLSSVSLGSGATASIALVAMGARVNLLPTALSGATFTADLSGVAQGTVVFYSSDSTVLAKVQTDLASSVPQGSQLTVSGDALSLEAVSAYVFNASGNLLTNLTSWSTGSLPPAGVEVAIDGVVAEFTEGVIPAWASIEVKNGARLKISADADLPPIALNKNATLEIASGTAVLTNGLSGMVLVNGENVTIPMLVVASDATLKVPGGMKFKNVNISLEGTLTRTSSGNLVFGHALNGETSYIGFHAKAARISNYPTGSYGTSICICCPDSGGYVRPVGSLEFKDMPTSGTHLPESGDNYWNGLALGENNPSSIPFEVVFDNTKWSASGISKITGAATFRLKNGSRFANKEHDNMWGRRFDITGLGKVILEDESELCIYAMGDWGSRVANVESTVSGGVALEAGEGSKVEFYRTVGNGNAVMSFSNSIYRVHRPSIYHDNNGTIYNSKNEPFNGLGGVTLAEGSTLTFSTCNGYYFKDDSGERVVALADVPITGGGSIALSNDNVNVFGVIVRSGANTATGTASVTEPASGKGATSLYFADGANWAGTVVAGNVALTNLTSAASPTSATFGALDLMGDFPVRVWKVNGAVTTNDVVNVGTYVNSGGILVPTLVGEGALDVNDVIVIGRIRKNSDLPRCARGWACEVTAKDGDDEYDVLSVRKGAGFQVIFR